jgi:phosphatidate phosphatase APP1
MPQRTTDSSLPILFVSRSPPPFLDTLEKSLSYPVPTALPFLLHAFALQLVRSLGALKRIPFFHRQLREQR